MGKYPQKNSCPYLESIKLQQGCSNHESRKEMLMTWHFVLLNLWNIVCGKPRRSSLVKGKNLCMPDFHVKTDSWIQHFIFPSYSYIKIPTLPMLCRAKKTEGSEVKTFGFGVNLGPAFSSLMFWHQPGVILLPPCIQQCKETLAQFPGSTNRGGWKGMGLEEHSLWSSYLFLNLVMAVTKIHWAITK